MITKEEYKKYTSAGFNVVPISKELDIDGAVFITTKNKLSINDTAKSINTCKKFVISLFHCNLEIRRLLVDIKTSY